MSGHRPEWEACRRTIKAVLLHFSGRSIAELQFRLEREEEDSEATAEFWRRTRLRFDRGGESKEGEEK